MLQIKIVIGLGIIMASMIAQLAYASPLNMEFIPIKPGKFLMGSPKTELYRYNDEAQHFVQLTEEFELQSTPVTQEQYYALTGVNPSHHAAKNFCSSTFEIRNGIAICPNHPVEQVSWNDVQVFLKKLNLQAHDGYFYRLPTEAEWEYAARAGTETAYYFGDDVSLLPQYAWFSDNARGMTHEVAQLKKNPWGLYDMEGNILQWVQDWYGDYAYAGSKNPQGNPTGTLRVSRGGSWFSAAKNVRVAVRYVDEPNATLMNVGFRLLRIRSN